MLGKNIERKKMLVRKQKIKTKIIKILIVFPGNGAKFDNVVVDAIKLILLIYNNFSIIKKVVNKIERVK